MRLFRIGFKIKMKFIYYTFFCLIILGFSSSNISAQDKSNFSARNRSYNKGKYAKSIMKPKKKCNTINRKRTQKPRKKLISKRIKPIKVKKGAETNYTSSTPKPAPITPKPAPKPTPKPEPITPKPELTETKETRDEVLVKNNLPTPTSQKHEEIRKKVEKQLETIEDDKPIKLEPLYFTFDQDEFAFVDMEPFLVAVEYALQGRMLLIEGHTDGTGADTYNVQLSIKRVERIRSLMIDMGVPDDRISIVGYGEEHAESGDKSQNDRRVDFTVF